MSIDVRINNYTLRDLLEAPPVVKDDIEAVCRSLKVKVRAADGLENFIGQPVELWYGGKLWYFGFMFRRNYDAKGNIDYVAYDPLYYWKKTKDDYYYKNMTATQILKNLAAKTGVKAGTLANTGVVFPALYYQGATPDKIGVDTLVRTSQQSGKKYWYRYDPVEGLTLFERTVPKEVWAFQVGVNLEAAEYEESIEETATVVKLVNRETGKTVLRKDDEALKKYGNLVHYEEVDKDQAPHMEKKAQDLLKALAKVNVSSRIEGINPDQVMPQFFSGDVIYVEEKYTNLIGAYHIRNVSQSFEAGNLVRLSMDIQAAPEIPPLQYEDATDAPKSSKTTGGSGVSTNTEYSEEMQKLIDQYGLEAK